MLLILEDDDERIKRFRATWRLLAPRQEMHVWRDAHAMIREAGRYLPAATLISLDHDLERAPGAPDPGDGVIVVKWLASQLTIVPVIIHSSNGERVQWMIGDLDLAGWRHWRAVPFDENWIEAHWSQVVRDALEF